MTIEPTWPDWYRPLTDTERRALVVAYLEGPEVIHPVVLEALEYGTASDLHASMNIGAVAAMIATRIQALSPEKQAQVVIKSPKAPEDAEDHRALAVLQVIAAATNGDYADIPTILAPWLQTAESATEITGLAFHIGRDLTAKIATLS